jgi:hypothetical protein
LSNAKHALAPFYVRDAGLITELIESVKKATADRRLISSHRMAEPLIGSAEGRLDPEDMIAKMVEVIPAKSGNFRNVHPPFVENALRKHQAEMFTLKI